MARPRSELHAIFKAMAGVQEAYFQPEQNVKMKYPCIRYTRDDSWVTRADNILYWLKKRYQVIVIDQDPDSLIPDQVEALPLTQFDRSYVAAGLNHFVFNVFF